MITEEDLWLPKYRDAIQLFMFYSVWNCNSDMHCASRFAHAIELSSDDAYDNAVFERAPQMLELIGRIFRDGRKHRTHHLRITSSESMQRIVRFTG